MQHLSVMRAFALRLGGYLSGLVWTRFGGETECRGVVAEPFSGSVVELGVT